VNPAEHEPYIANAEEFWLLADGLSFDQARTVAAWWAPQIGEPWTRTLAKGRGTFRPCKSTDEHECDCPHAYGWRFEMYEGTWRR
jgi:hypothetical protein